MDIWGNVLKVLKVYMGNGIKEKMPKEENS